jgi:hypothetical protein
MSEISDLDMDEDLEKEVEKLMAEDEFKDMDFNISQKTNITKGFDSKDYLNGKDDDMKDLKDINDSIKNKMQLLKNEIGQEQNKVIDTKTQLNHSTSENNQNPIVAKEPNQKPKSVFDDDFNIDDMDIEIDAELEAEIARYLETEDFDLGMDDVDFKTKDKDNESKEKDQLINAVKNDDDKSKNTNNTNNNTNTNLNTNNKTIEAKNPDTKSDSTNAKNT